MVDNPPGTPVLGYAGATTHALYQPNGSGGSTLIRLSGWGGSGSGLNWIGAACAGMPVSDEIQYGGDFTLFLPSLGEIASNQDFRGANGDFNQDYDGDNFLAAVGWAGGGYTFGNSGAIYCAKSQWLMRGNFAVPAPYTVHPYDADGINQNDHTQIYVQTTGFDPTQYDYAAFNPSAPGVAKTIPNVGGIYTWQPSDFGLGAGAYGEAGFRSVAL